MKNLNRQPKRFLVEIDDAGGSNITMLFILTQTWHSSAGK